MQSESGVGVLRPIKILHVVGSLNRGGIETWLHEVVGRLPRERYESDFCTYRRGGRGAYAAELEHCGCKLHHIPLGGDPLAVLRFSGSFRRLVREGRYDIVHCHGLLLVGFIMFLAWLERTPVRIAHGHNSRPTGGPVSVAGALAMLLNRVLARAFSTRAVGCSPEAAAALFGGGWREGVKCEIIHCGINLKPFEVPLASSARDELGIPRGAKVIGHVGSFSIAKNQRFLVDVAAHVFRRCPDAMLLLVGEGALRPSVEESCADLGIRSRVIFAGESSRVPELMRSAMDALVMPSLHEGLPLALLEAQAAGLPCLVSDVVSREAVISEGSVQFLSLASGAGAWGDAVLSLLEKPARRPDLLARMANSDFNAVVSAQRLEDLYSMAQAYIARDLSAPSTDDLTAGRSR